MHHPVYHTIDPTHVYLLKGKLKFYQPNLQGLDVSQVVLLYRPLVRMTNGNYTLVRFASIGNNLGLMRLDYEYEVQMLLRPAQAMLDMARTGLGIDQLLPARSALEIHSKPGQLRGKGVIDWVTTTPNHHLTKQPKQRRNINPRRAARDQEAQLLQQLGNLHQSQQQWLQQLFTRQLQQHLSNQLQQTSSEQLHELLVNACRDNDTAVAWAALRAGALPLALRDGERSPLIYAAEQRNRRLVAMLLHYGAPVNYNPRKHGNALWYAASNNDWRMIHLLLDYGADDLVVHTGERPSHLVASESDFDFDLGELIAYAAAINNDQPRRSVGRVLLYFALVALIVIMAMVLDTCINR